MPDDVPAACGDFRRGHRHQVFWCGRVVLGGDWRSHAQNPGQLGVGRVGARAQLVDHGVPSVVGGAALVLAPVGVASVPGARGALFRAVSCVLGGGALGRGRGA